jgi:hypothetical protein
MNKQEIDLMVENFLKPQKNNNKKQMDINELFSLINEVQQSIAGSGVLNEAQAKRFSVDIPIPKLTPTEAWGNPANHSRQEVDRIFASITKQGGMKERIQHLNSFLDTKQAIKKAPGGKINKVLNVLQIIEALQAALNDYNEASAGFVFEGFMAALTKGSQVSERVGGTLPIEDFITETGENVSLKLLSPKTGIHGSFTNLVDYLFLRGNTGESKIKYLVAYKDVEGDNVSKLAIFDFMITRDNFVDAMMQTRNQKLFGNYANELKAHTTSWDDTPEWRLSMAQTMKNIPGYDQKRGMFNKIDETGNLVSAPSEEGGEEEVGGKAGYTQRASSGYMLDFENTAEEAALNYANNPESAPSFEVWYQNNVTPEVLTKLGKTSVNSVKKFKDQIKAIFDNAMAKKQQTLAEFYFGKFHAEEKRLLNEGKLSGGEGGAQWSITGPDLYKLNDLLSTEFYGELNLSQANIDELTKIYIEKIGEDLMKLLQTTKDFTENIGKYFSSTDRTEAIAANQTAINQGGQIITTLATDPAGLTQEQQPEV